MADHAQAAGEQLLDEIVLFVVERRSAEVGDRRALHQSRHAGCGASLFENGCSRESQTRAAIMSMAASEIEVLPRRGVGRAMLRTFVARPGMGD